MNSKSVCLSVGLAAWRYGCLSLRYISHYSVWYAKTIRCIHLTYLGAHNAGRGEAWRVWLSRRRGANPAQSAKGSASAAHYSRISLARRQIALVDRDFGLLGSGRGMARGRACIWQSSLTN